jgi:hypothetical protein
MVEEGVVETVAVINLSDAIHSGDPFCCLVIKSDYVISQCLE